jgi:SAM-dependent methyltransferase
MHPAVNAAFDRLCRRYWTGGAVLEIGAMPAPDTLLNLPTLRQSSLRLGVNIDGSSHIGAAEILALNANDMAVLDSSSFDLVVCNSTLEHDPTFWMTLSEVRRLLRPGGIAIYGVPGYIASTGKGLGLMARLWPSPLPGAAWIAGAAATTATLHVHNFPGDYYRFSRQAMAEALLADLDVKEIETLLHPPRIIGVGRKRD